MLRSSFSAPFIFSDAKVAGSADVTAAALFQPKPFLLLLPCRYSTLECLYLYQFTASFLLYLPFLEYSADIFSISTPRVYVGCYCTIVLATYTHPASCCLPVQSAKLIHPNRFSAGYFNALHVYTIQMCTFFCHWEI